MNIIIKICLLLNLGLKTLNGGEFVKQVETGLLFISHCPMFSFSLSIFGKV